MEKETFFMRKDNEKKEQIIQPPENCYFIHGVKNWSKKNSIGIGMPEISCSLQKDKFTKPIRPYGYILQLNKGAIIAAYERDVTSRYYDASFKKKLSEQTEQKKYRNYSEEELDELIKNTKKDCHNELWVDGEQVEIVGAYIDESEVDIPGIRAFIRTCNRENLKIRFIEKP